MGYGDQWTTRAVSVEPGLRANALKEGSAPIHQPCLTSTGSISEPREDTRVHLMTRKAACPALSCSSKGVPPIPWLSAGLWAPAEQCWRAKQRLSVDCWCHAVCFTVTNMSGDHPHAGDQQHLPGPAMSSAPSVYAASASSWPMNRTGQAKINTHLAGTAALRSLLREEAVLASAGSSLPRAGSTGRPRCSPCVVTDRPGQPNPSPRMERVPLQPAARLCIAEG